MTTQFLDQGNYFLINYPQLNYLFRLSITFAQNESDSTFGWNGALHGFNVHYRYPTEKMFKPGHSIYLSSALVSQKSIYFYLVRHFYRKSQPFFYLTKFSSKSVEFQKK
jgi:hypothetical protein